MNGGPSTYDVYSDFEFTPENCPGWTQEQINAANWRNEGFLGDKEQKKESRWTAIDG